MTQGAESTGALGSLAWSYWSRVFGQQDVTVLGQMGVCRCALLFCEPDCDSQSEVIALGQDGEAAKAQGTLREQVSKSETCPLSPAQPRLSG